MKTISWLEAYDAATWIRVADSLEDTGRDLGHQAEALRAGAAGLRLVWVSPTSTAAAQQFERRAAELSHLAGQEHDCASVIVQAASEMGARQGDLAKAAHWVRRIPVFTLHDDTTVEVAPVTFFVSPLAYLVARGHASSASYQMRMILISAEAEMRSQTAALFAVLGEGLQPPDGGPLDLDDESIRLTADVNQQDSYGDCVTLSMLLGLGRGNPQWVRDHLTWDPVKKKYLVTIYSLADGKPMVVEVDPTTLPARGAQAYGSGDPTWISVMEEAYRKQYPDIVDGKGATHPDVAKIVTGQTVTRDAGSFADIKSTLTGPPPGAVVVGTSGATENQPSDVDPEKRTVRLDGGRDGTHAYAVKGFDDQGRIVLSNPWGPQGGWIKGTYYPGELHLTEDEFKKWFNTSTRVPGT